MINDSLAEPKCLQAACSGSLGERIKTRASRQTKTCFQPLDASSSSVSTHSAPKWKLRLSKRSPCLQASQKTLRTKLPCPQKPSDIPLFLISLLLTCFAMCSLRDVSVQPRKHIEVCRLAPKTPKASNEMMGRSPPSSRIPGFKGAETYLSTPANCRGSRHPNGCVKTRERSHWLASCLLLWLPFNTRGSKTW